ncbi:MAG: class I SAM-dependent methyltransferase [Minisyncoccota bacterium]
MKENTFEFIKTANELFDLPSPILEIGSLRVESQKIKFPLFKDIFINKKVVGCDMRPGYGVDVVENAESLSFKDKSFSTVILADTIEHAENFFKIIEEAHRVLDDNGIIIITSFLILKFIIIHRIFGDFPHRGSRFC